MKFFPNAGREIRRISKQDVSPKRSADNVTRSYFRHYVFYRTAVSQPSKYSVSLTTLLLCNFKGLVFDFYLNPKRDKCWLAVYSCDLFTYQLAYFDRSECFAIDRTTLTNMPGGGGYSLIWAIRGTCRWIGYGFLASLS